MTRYTSESISRLKLHMRLVEIIGGYVELKPAGRLYKGCCPFHDEKSASFVVDPSDQHYHCYGCGAHGDALGFLMNYLQVPFQSAIEMISEKSGVTLEVDHSIQQNSQEAEKKRLRLLMSAAADFFHGILLHTNEGHKALSYLYKRGIDLDMVIKFRLGWIPDGNVMTDYLISRGFTLAECHEGGLVSQATNRRTPFSTRIAFPLYEVSASVVGFSARKIEEEVFGGKYINSPETLLFKKSKFLFGMYQSRRRIAKDRYAILVEGQIDALRLIHSGLDCTVAALGTAFGENHCQLLMQIGIKEVIIAFDRDKAGIQAALKVGDLFQKRGTSVTVVVFPNGEDPDSYLLSAGSERFGQLLEERIDYLTFLAEVLSQGEDVTSPQGKNRLIKELVERIRAWNQPTLIHQSLLWVATRFDLPPHLLGITGTTNTAGRSRGSIKTTLSLEKGLSGMGLEDDLIRWLLWEKEEVMALTWIEVARRQIAADELLHPFARLFYHFILEQAKEKIIPTYLTLTNQLVELSQDSKEGEEAIDMAQGLEYLNHLSLRKVTPERSFERFIETLQRLLDRNWLRQRQQIHELLSSKALPPGEEGEWLERFSQLLRTPPKVSTQLEKGIIHGV